MAEPIVPMGTSDHDFRADPDESEARVWRLQYGPCWCFGTPPGAGSFDFIRFSTTTQDLGAFEGSIVIFSERVIDGTSPVFLQVLDRVPNPRLVVSTRVCPTAERFWDELPVGWAQIEDVLPVDLHIDECVTGNPETLLAGVLGYILGEGPSIPAHRPWLAASGRG